MASNNTHQLTIRLDDQTYKALKALANKRSESMAVVARRILAKKLGIEIALGASDTLISIVRKAVAVELRKTEARLAATSCKAVIAAASAENCALYLIKEQKNFNKSQIDQVANETRHKGVIFLKQPLDLIYDVYQEGEDGGN